MGFTVESLSEFMVEFNVWINSPEGKAAIKKAIDDAKEISERFRQAEIRLK